ncbi:MAG: outer membrane beta-barrel protein [Sideroxyarcus sp.]|nr:outer membrane beta-barrel protein [Sideroxyarcus sp.]
MDKILPVVLLSLAIAAPAVAAPVTGAAGAPTAATSPSARAAESNHWFYLGARLGDSTVGGLLGVQITRRYSLEFSYDYIDTVYQPNTTIKASTAGAAAVGMFPVKFGDLDPFFIFAKAGYERTTTKSTTINPGIPGLPVGETTTEITTIRKRPVVGAGAQYDFTRSFSGRIGKNALGNDKSFYIAAIYQF